MNSVVTAITQAGQDVDGINNNTSEVSFDLHYGFETECDDMITEHERPKAPEPMILESLSNYDLSELLGKDEMLHCITVEPAEVSGSSQYPVCVTSNNTIMNINSSNMEYLVLEDIDDSDYIDSQVLTTRSSFIQAISQEPLIDDKYLGSAKPATMVSQKSIISTKASSRSRPSRLRRLASSITRAMSNKLRKFRRPIRVEESSKNDGVVDGSASTQHLLQTYSTAREFTTDI